jgi:hypothetical protein
MIGSWPVTSIYTDNLKIETSRGDFTEMNMFNELISDLDLIEIPFSGRDFTWSNM